MLKAAGKDHFFNQVTVSVVSDVGVNVTELSEAIHDETAGSFLTENT